MNNIDKLIENLNKEQKEAVLSTEVQILLLLVPALEKLEF